MNFVNQLRLQLIKRETIQFLQKQARHLGPLKSQKAAFALVIFEESLEKTQKNKHANLVITSSMHMVCRKNSL